MMVYNIQTQSSSFGHCQSCNRYMHTKHYVSEAGSASVLRQEAPSLLNPLDHAIIRHWIPLKYSQV